MDESTQQVKNITALRRQLSAWFEKPLGRSLQACEANRMRSVLPSLYAANVLQLGRIGSVDLFESIAAPKHILLDTPGAVEDNHVLALPEALPFDCNSIDLVLLPHTLDFALDPHQVLREVARVLIPEGHIVLAGFNPYSLWGLRRRLMRKSKRRQVPWHSHFISLRRMKDWLRLMHFEICNGSMAYYRPPLTKQSSLDRLYHLDKMGNRWWPMMGAVYFLVAKKKLEGMMPIRPRWGLRAVPVNRAANGATRGIAARVQEKGHRIG